MGLPPPCEGSDFTPAHPSNNIFHSLHFPCDMDSIEISRKKRLGSPVQRQFLWVEIYLILPSYVSVRCWEKIRRIKIFVYLQLCWKYPAGGGFSHHIFLLFLLLQELCPEGPKPLLKNLLELECERKRYIQVKAPMGFSPPNISTITPILTH